jgi:hypothetical protein
MNTGLCLNDLRKMTPAFAGRQVKKFAEWGVKRKIRLDLG